MNEAVELNGMTLDHGVSKKFLSLLSSSNFGVDDAKFPLKMIIDTLNRKGTSIQSAIEYAYSVIQTTH